jgi:hypothetical protein
VAQQGAAWLRQGAAWLRQQRVGLLYGKPEFESWLGIPEEAMRSSRVASTSIMYKVLYVCSVNVKTNKKSGSMPPNLKKKKKNNNIGAT